MAREEETATDRIAGWLLLGDSTLYSEALKRAEFDANLLRDWALRIIWNASPEDPADVLADLYSREDLYHADWRQIRARLLME